jgi:hypothetical protein
MAGVYVLTVPDGTVLCYNIAHLRSGCSSSEVRTRASLLWATRLSRLTTQQTVGMTNTMKRQYLPEVTHLSDVHPSFILINTNSKLWESTHLQLPLRTVVHKTAHIDLA